MGRKKIEIRPLNDERNRNVTFLKRKAGLMKKAWELSVLCAADVSILIFNAAGKAYEFSSKDLDEEIDKYFDYEGLIERRRAPEFAAMALAGEDEEDEDEDDAPRRGSSSKQAQQNGPNPPKSLKGKESFKSKMISRNEMNRAVMKAREKAKKSKGGSRKRRRTMGSNGEDKKSFVDAILESDEDSSEESEDEIYGVKEENTDGRRRTNRRDERGEYPDEHPGLSGLHYAMNMHQQPASHMSNPDVMSNYFARGALPNNIPRQSQDSWRHQDMSHQNVYGQNLGQSSPHYPQPNGQSPVGPLPGLPAGMQWDQNLLARYAEFQLQQNHQRQQRLLLERQRVQLQELGIPVEDKTLLDQLFGGNSNPSSNGSSGHHQNIPQSETPIHLPPLTDGFEWPTVSQTRGSPMGMDKQSLPQQQHQDMYGISIGGQSMHHLMSAPPNGHNGHAGNGHSSEEMDNIPWGIGNEEHMPFPSPASPGLSERHKRDREMFEGMNNHKRRV